MDQSVSSEEKEAGAMGLWVGLSRDKREQLPEKGKNLIGLL